MADNKHQGKFLFVRYQDLVPGFKRAYWLFTSLPILGHCIRAHLEIYRIIGPAIEQAVVGWASGSAIPDQANNPVSAAETVLNAETL